MLTAIFAKRGLIVERFLSAFFFFFRTGNHRSYGR
jgi:hypothetical protein